MTVSTGAVMLNPVFVGITAAMLRDIIKETTSYEVCSELRVIFKHVKCKFNRSGK
jgi:hypothetical protein